MLPGVETPKGKLAYGVGAMLLIALCVWQLVGPAGGGARRGVPFMVVCDACGEVDDAREIAVGSDGAALLPVECSRCGEKAAYLAYMCPSCGEPLPVDPKKPPTQCKHCGADLKGMFDPPSR